MARIWEYFIKRMNYASTSIIINNVKYALSVNKDGWYLKPMPLNKKGTKIMKAVKKTYKSKEKAEEVFYASKNKGKIKGVEKKRKKK